MMMQQQMVASATMWWPKKTKVATKMKEKIDEKKNL